VLLDRTSDEVSDSAALAIGGYLHPVEQVGLDAYRQ